MPPKSLIAINLILLWLCGAAQARQFDDDFLLLSPMPYQKCVSAYLTPQTDSAGNAVAAPFGNFYCLSSIEGNDFPLLDRIDANIQSIGRILEVSVSANFFDTAHIAKRLCAVGIDDGAMVKIYVQRSDQPIRSVGSHIRADFVAPIFRCARKVQIYFIGCDVFEKETCPKNQTNSHHVKSIRIRGKNGSLYVFGSGNFTTSSLSRNIENWLIFRTKSARTIQDFECIFEFLENLAARPDLRFDQQRDLYRGCRALSKRLKGIRLFVVPFESMAYLDEFKRAVKKAKKVTLVGQFIESEWLLELIKKSADKDFEIIVDDAYHYASREPSSSKGFNFVSPEMAKKLTTFASQNANVVLRYIQTNHHYNHHGQTNTVHARTVLFDNIDGSTTMMVGSAHFRDGALRNNTEQQFFLYGDRAIAQRALIDDLVKRSVLADGLPTSNAIATPMGK